MRFQPVSDMQNLTPTMAQLEIDSFIVKFKELLISGRNATLEIKAVAGKAEVNLRVELDDVSKILSKQGWPCSGPSRQRRRLRRAAEREAAKANTENDTPAEKVGRNSLAREATQAEKAEEAAQAEKADEAAQAEKVSQTEDLIVKNTEIVNEPFKDEFCSDRSFDNEMVERILVTADCQADWSDEVVTKLVREKLDIIGIKMSSIAVNRNVRRCFESCIVKIEPVEKHLIKKEGFPMRRWTMNCIM